MKRLWIKSLVVVFIFLSGCVNSQYSGAVKNISVTQDRIAASKQHYSVLPRAAAFRGQAEPAWLQRPVEIHAEHLPFSFIAEKIIPSRQVYVNFEDEALMKKEMNFRYKGSAKGALRALQTTSGFAYTLSPHQVEWTHLETRSFDISFMPGASTYLLGHALQAGPNTEAANGLSSDSQYTNLKGHLSVWDDLRETLDQLKSPTGLVSISEATTTVTVKDTPAHVRAIANYLKELNRKLSREVALSVQVLEITLSDGFNYGIDWKLVREFMDLHVGLTGQLAKPVMLTALGGNTNAGEAGFILRSVQGKWEGTDLLLNALSQQGHVSTITRPRVVTLNNQVAEIDINQQTGYLKEVTSTTTGASPATVTSLMPGTIKTGFTLYILPKIESRDVYLQLSSTISSLMGIQTITANPNAFVRDNSQIQLPTVSEKHFNQRTLVPNGATLVLAGFKQLHNEANRTELLKSQALGSQGAKQENTETLILITPIIITR